MRGKRQQIYIGSLSSLKLVKDSVGEVPDGTECGMSFTDFQDFEEDDVIEIVKHEKTIELPIRLSHPKNRYVSNLQKQVIENLTLNIPKYL